MAKSKKNNIRVSVIIPCYNGKSTIRQTLKAVCGQQTDFAFEVIVVDSSYDGTDGIIRDEFADVRLIRLEGQTLPGSGRNLGVQHAKGDIVAFTDADAVPDPDWIDNIVRLHDTLKTDAVGGCVINGYTGSPTAWVSHLIEFSTWVESKPAGYVTKIPSVNISYKRSVFKKYRICFSDIFPSEDTLFNWALTERGGKIYFDPSVRVVHLSRLGIRKLFRHQLRLGQAAAHARRISSLPGRIFIDHPWLCLILPVVRWALAGIRLIRKHPKRFVVYVGLTPLFFGASIAWTVGFMQHQEFPPPKYVIDGCDYDVFRTENRGIR
ncbi:glycosyltransferase [bacterium]|nr:glycosyltransferase [bacterium]